MKKNLFIYKSPFGDLGCLFDRGGFLIKIALLNRVSERTDFHPFFEELHDFFEGSLKIFKQRYKIMAGTGFEREVWDTLKDIPYGETKTYKWLADRIGRQKAFRAVGQALKKNPLPIIIPCHRVICSNGFIGGFLWGIEIKRFLLDHERANF